MLYMVLGCENGKKLKLVKAPCAMYRKTLMGPIGTSLKGKWGQRVQPYIHVRVRCALPSLSLSYWLKTGK